MACTDDAVVRSLVSPLFSRSMAVTLSDRLVVSSLRNSFSSSRYDLGVLNTALLSVTANLAAALFTLSNAKGMKRSTPSRIADTPPKSTSRRKRTPTECSASFGQGWNQSMVAHEISAGNRVARSRKSSLGEKHKAT